MKKILLLMLFAMIPIAYAIPTTLNLQITLKDDAGNLQSMTDNINASINTYSGLVLYSTNDSVTFDDGIGYMTLPWVTIPFNQSYHINLSGSTIGDLGGFNYSSVPTAFRANTTDYLDGDKDYKVRNMTASWFNGFINASWIKEFPTRMIEYLDMWYYYNNSIVNDTDANLKDLNTTNTTAINLNVDTIQTRDSNNVTFFSNQTIYGSLTVCNTTGGNCLRILSNDVTGGNEIWTIG